VIECNLRASRSFPFVSKVFKINFIDIATRAMLGENIPKIEKSAFDLDYVGVKAPMFSFARLKGADPTLSVEMASTGEVACFGDDIYEAFLKAFLSVGYKIPKRSVLVSTGTPEDKADLLHSCQLLAESGFTIYATTGTYDYLKQNGIGSIKLYRPLEDKKPNSADFIKERKVELVVNIPKSFDREELTNGYIIRRAAIDYNIPLITNVQIAKLFIRAINTYKENSMLIKAWSEYTTS